MEGEKLPLVIINSGPRARGRVIEKLANNLQGLVAESLTCENPDGKLVPADIELWHRPRDLSRDRGFKDLQIVVFANDYPERRVDLDKRVRKLRNAIRALLPPDIHGWVWVRLAPSSFAEF